MSTTFPTIIDVLTNPTATDSVATVDHAAQHANANDAIEALEAKVGANSSAVTTSHDYKLSEVTSTDKAVGKTATQTLTNKTLTSPTINNGTIVTPTIASFTNATHNHTNAAGGGQLTDAALSTQVTVPKGGTGVTSLTAYAPIYGGTTSTAAVQSGTVGTLGQVLTSNGAGVLPTFQSLTTSLTTTSSIPQSAAFIDGAGTISLNVNTTGYFGRCIVTTGITAAKITFQVVSVTTPGNIVIALYSEDGQSKVIASQTINVTATGANSATFTGVAISPGNYYIAVVSSSTTSISVGSYLIENTQGVDSLYQIGSEPMYSGTLTVSSGTLPATFTTSSLTYNAGACLVFRLDN